MCKQTRFNDIALFEMNVSSARSTFLSFRSKNTTLSDGTPVSGTCYDLCAITINELREISRTVKS